jgi:hypothetical protein
MRLVSWLLIASLNSLCCRSEEPKVPPPEAEPGLEVVDPDWNPEPTAVESARPDPPKTRDAASTRDKPEFRDGMSVEEAIRAVPTHYDYIGIDQDALERPLKDPEAFKPCRGAETHRFAIRVAVWDGKAVGIDVEAPPALRQCITEQIKKMEWRDKVQSINTIRYSF